ncbi:MAG TPA: PDR/VanB family oxidoreductase [Casimicrobiaceae bacterium]|nr:PDR/VanB family oxidoreductase [Casimicrobiaceae bacterium]
MSTNTAQEWRRVRVLAVRDVAIDVRAFDLAAADGRPLPSYTAGAHIDVHVPAGMVRQYSLCGDLRATDRYVIAVKKEPVSRGGSLSMHEDVEVDSVLAIGTPRNYFALASDAAPSLLIAGGIGITPIYAMAQSLAAEGRDFALHYCARSEAHAAFHAELQALAPGRLVTHFSEVPVLNVAGLLAAQPAQTHVYCCGPVGLMAAVKDAASHWETSRVHFEWFAAPAVDRSHDGSFEIELKRSGRVLNVPADRTILQVLRDNGIDAASSCEEGVCGTCETALLEGAADHRDLLLTPEERASNRTIMICCSRARSSRLVLDL